MGELHGWRVCPRCRGPLAGAETAPLTCALCGSAYYANPAPSVSALIENAAGTHVLIGRRAVEPARGLWDTVGGFLEEGEEPLAGLRREVQEETGLDVEIGPFLGVWPELYGDGPAAPHTLNLCWVATVVAGEPRAADDVSELRWFTAAELEAGIPTAFGWVAHALTAWCELRG